jgi:hypothetical protein
MGKKLFYHLCRRAQMFNMIEEGLLPWFQSLNVLIKCQGWPLVVGECSERDVIDVDLILHACNICRGGILWKDCRSGFRVVGRFLVSVTLHYRSALKNALRT